MVSLARHPAPAQVCYGFEVDPPFALRFTRPGGGIEHLRLAEHRSPSAVPAADPVFEVSDQGRRIAALWGRGSEYHFMVEGLGWYRVDPLRRLIEVPADGEPIRREQVLWGVPATLCFSERGDVSIHAAAVEIEGRAILLAAPGHYGKTTLAMAFHEAGYRVLTEDSACCSSASGLSVRPGPSIVRLRSPGGAFPAGLELAQLRNGRAELEIAADRRGTGDPVPVRAIVFLRESTGAPALEPRAAPDTLRDLWALNFALPYGDARARSFKLVADLAYGVPGWNLHRRLDPALLESTVARIVETVL